MQDEHTWPRSVREVELEWIPMPDGTRLAARLFLPEDAQARPVPAILEYIPYRRRDSTRDGDNLTHPWFAEQGYACVRLDIRGTGDSEGVIRDEYLKQEQDDAVEAITWIAKQPWCTGKVGMMGISWGGFNSLQVAARRPEALKAIITVCSTDDRYADDMHYMGGCIVTDTMAWGTSFFGRMARAPDPLMVGEGRWRTMWRERLEGWEPPFITWLQHQSRDDFWKHGSVREDYGKVECAVFAVGGWADGYSNAIFRMLSGLKCPRLGLVGPWGHKYPHNGMPGPAIGFLQEAKRWWDQWLKGVDTGIMREPMLRAWVQESVPPAAHYDMRPGYWAGETAWPGPNIAERSCALGRNTLSAPAPAAERTHKPSTGRDRAGNSPALAIASPQSVGQHAGEWCPYGMGGLSPELPLDQREEDGGSLLFDTEQLEAPVTILGAPVVELDLESEQPEALVTVRLNDLRPDGSDLRVTYGVLNLTHRNGHDRPVPLEPGKRVRIRVQMNEIGHIFPAGHRLRLAISTAYWPTVWPSPRSVRLLVHTGSSRLVLPVRERRASDERIHFEPPAKGRATARTVLVGAHQERTVTRDVAANEVIYTVLRDEGRSIIDEIAVESGFEKKVVYRIKPDDPTSARVDLREAFLLRHRQGWDTFVEAQAALSSTESDFLVEASLKASEGGKPFFARSWLQRIPRKGV
ncbi:MAG: CocE/NonD family hydrolase [Dongiaceae bacterium]